MLPLTLLNNLQDVKGFNQQAFEQVHASGEQVTSIRINTEKVTRENFTSTLPYWALNNLQPTLVPWCEHGYYLAERPSFTLDPIFHGGAYYVQDASSMFLWQVLLQTINNTNNKKVLDVCAAPGGKSTLLANYFIDGLIVSNEVIKSRVPVLVENITKWGAANVVVTNNDPSHFKSVENYFDLVVVDAPCSGSGLFRKNKDAIQEWSENNVNLCSQRQQRIVADILPCLKEDGIIIYSTCSYSKEENENTIDWLMDEFDMVSIPIKIDETWGITETETDKNKASCYRFYPDKVKGEGFFIAVLAKKGNATDKKLKEQIVQSPTQNELAVLNNFIQLSEEWTLFKHGAELKIINQQLLSDVKILANYLYIKKAGVCLGELKGKDIVPNHELALSTMPLTNIATLELSKEDALQYLRRKEIKIDAAVGWALITHKNIRLGWVKVLPNRINNYYPQEWRIIKN